MTRPIRLHPVDDDEPPDRPVLLNPRDEAILNLLRAGANLPRIEAIGVYRKAWTTADVDRIIALYTGTTTRADPDRVPWRPWNAKEPRPYTASPPREVDLSVRQVEVLDGLCRGHNYATIGVALGVAERSVRGYAASMVRAMAAEDVEDAVWMARTGEVRLFIVERRGRRAAA